MGSDGCGLPLPIKRMARRRFRLADPFGWRPSHQLRLLRDCNDLLNLRFHTEHYPQKMEDVWFTCFVKHAFMALSQVAKHGGEITRQLQELADAVGNQRETKIEAKIKKLELEATAPVALVFLGFLVILLIGFGVQIKNAFG